MSDKQNVANTYLFNLKKGGDSDNIENFEDIMLGGNKPVIKRQILIPLICDI